MDVQFDHLSQQIFNKPLEECSEQEIRSFVEEHPYFSPGQFLLLKKLEKNSEAYQVQYQKAILYYHDPVAFDFLVNAEEFDIDIEEIILKDIPANQSEVISESEEETIIEPKKEVYQDNTHEEKSSTEQGTMNSEQEKIEVQAFPEQGAVSSEQLAFEPFHTVDYFASLGIKLSQEEATRDRMGKQLKSFTEWLKTMKRLPGPGLEKKMSGDSEQKVENMAEDSVQSADIVTEAMAEVWVKQGNAAKAIEVYSKLSLQNPSKSLYFAAKIDLLKEQN
ncbi:MAG: hypothetical protein M3352_01785 [Bacteroidota bacterium]|nr:hypothetical protein [Bacteroidota bacterium]